MGALVAFAGAAIAQQAPSAGSILRQLEPDTPSLPAPKADTSPDRHEAPPPTGPAIHVREFRIDGNQRIRSEQIQKVLSAYVNRDLTPADLRQATDDVARFYNRAGWLARL
jgi:hemolysin activation/secretion protein